MWQKCLFEAFQERCLPCYISHVGVLCGYILYNALGRYNITCFLIRPSLQAGILLEWCSAHAVGHFYPLSTKLNHVLVLGWCLCWFKVVSTCDPFCCTTGMRPTIATRHSLAVLFSSFPTLSGTAMVDYINCCQALQGVTLASKHD